MSAITGQSHSTAGGEPRSSEDAALLRAILDTAAEGIITIDTNAKMLSVNPAALTMFGYGEDELIGQNVSMLMPEPYQSRHDGYVSSYIETREARIIGTGREVEGRRKDGSVFPLGLAVSEVRLPGRRQFAGIVRDLSAWREAEELARLRLHELAHASRLLELGEMTSGLAHEINQPLTAVVSFAQACRRMLAAGTADPSLVADTLGRIVEQGERAAEIVKGLRGFARKHDDSREDTLPASLIDDVLRLLGHELRRRGVRCEVSGRDAAVHVKVNRIQIEQVMVNLIRNAIDAMESVPAEDRLLEVTVDAGDQGAGGCRIVVEDRGCGLPADGIDRLFDPFYTTKPDGMGVGLAISSTIAQAHGGSLTANAREDGGARFCLELPAGDDSGRVS